MAYNDARVIQKDPPEQGRIRMVLEFREFPVTSNPVLPDVKVDYYVDGGQSPAEANIALRWYAITSLARLNDRKSLFDAIPIPFQINLTPPAVPGPSAIDLWRAKGDRLVYAKALQNAGLTNAAAVAAITALAADLNDDAYPAGAL
jgi:hypothetical protein